MALHGGKKTVNGQIWNGKTGERTPVEWRRGLEHYQRHMFAHNDIDVFIHTPNTDIEQELRDAYKPKAAIFEPDPMFNAVGDKTGRDDPGGATSMRQINIARWHGIQQCMKLKKQYEKDNGFKYDMAMIGRFDVAWMVDVHFEKFDPNYFYASNWCIMKLPNGKGISHKNWFLHGWDKKENKELKHIHTGYPHTPHYQALADYWFFGGTEVMDEFGNLYDNVGRFIKGGVTCPHSFAFQQLRITGLLAKLKFAFHIHNDCFLSRFVYCDWRK